MFQEEQSMTATHMQAKLALYKALTLIRFKTQH